MKARLIAYLCNLGLALDQLACTLIGKDPRMTLGAVAWLHDLGPLMWLINTIYRDPDHCNGAALKWDTPDWQARDRSLWKP